MVDVHPIWRYRRQFAPIERGVGTADHRPRFRVRGGFASEVAVVKFRKGRVDVIDVEHDGRCNPLVGVDLDDVQRFILNRLVIDAGSVKKLESEAFASATYAQT